MSTECYPITVLPDVTRLYRDYLAMAEDTAVHRWYGASPFATDWMHAPAPVLDREALADALYAQSVAFDAGLPALANIERLRNGARAVVTGQQVGLFGGPLLTLLKAATAIARAVEASEATGASTMCPSSGSPQKTMTLKRWTVSRCSRRPRSKRLPRTLNAAIPAACRRRSCSAIRIEVALANAPRELLCLRADLRPVARVLFYRRDTRARLCTAHGASF